jgi:hypothetical protein
VPNTEHAFSVTKVTKETIFTYNLTEGCNWSQLQLENKFCSIIRNRYMEKQRIRKAGRQVRRPCAGRTETAF